jgi:alpha-glucosidase
MTTPSLTATRPASGPSASATHEPWWKGAVIYQVYPRSFADGNGDGVGDLAGVLARLPHIASLGVDAVWLSPFFTSPMKDFGYDIADYRGIDPIFGTMADFERVLDEAHRLGLKVIIDQVYSHTSDQHDWFAQSRADTTNAKADWYIWADPRPDGTPPNNWQSVFGGPAWEWDARRGQYYFHNFLKEQPDLNVHNPDVQEAILAVVRFWLDKGVDGFRLDALNFSMHDPLLRDNPPSGVSARDATRPFDMQRQVHSMSHPDIPAWLERIRAVTDDYPGCFTVAEIGGADAIREMKAFTEGGRRLNSAYNFDFLYARSLTPDGIRRSLGQWSVNPGEGWPSWAFSNHDAPRCISRWAPDTAREASARQCLMLLTALRGNAFLYQGEELALPQAEVGFADLQDPEAIANWPKTLGRDGARTPMPWKARAPHSGFSPVKPWLPVDPRHDALAVDRQEADPGSMLHFTRALLAARRELTPLRLGAMRFLETPDGLIAFIRDWQGAQVLCVFNLSQTPVDWSPEPEGHWRSVFTQGGETHAPLPTRWAPYSACWAVG